MNSKCMIVLLTTFVLQTTYSTNSTNTTQIQTATNFPVGQNIDNAILSRKRRFVESTGWTIKFTVTLTIPLEGVGSSVTVELPITYTFAPDKFSSGT